MVFEHHVPCEVMGLIDLDYSVFVQLGIFLVFLVLINFILFRPLMQTLDARRERTKGAREQADRDNAEAQDKIATYESELSKAVNEGAEVRKNLRSEGQSTAQARVSEAKEEQERRLADGTRKAREGYELARGSAMLHAKPLADAISGKLLELGKKG